MTPLSVYGGPDVAEATRPGLDHGTEVVQSPRALLLQIAADDADGIFRNGFC